MYTIFSDYKQGYTNKKTVKFIDKRHFRQISYLLPIQSHRL